MFCVVNLSEKLINLKHGQVVGFAYEVSDIIEGDTEEVKVKKVSTSSTVSSNEFPEHLCYLLARSVTNRKNPTAKYATIICACFC